MNWKKTLKSITEFIRTSLLENSPISSMRINAAMMTSTVCISVLYITVTTPDPGKYWEMYVGLFGVAMGMKVWQKFAENKKEEDENV